MHSSKSSLRINPGGLLSPSQIVGRDPFIAGMWATLEQQSVLLTSERRMGKTSVMHKMEREPPLRVCPIQTSLQGIDTPEEFARRLVADVEAAAPGVLAKPFLKRMQRAGVKRVGGRSVEVEFQPATDDAWKDVVTETLRTIDEGVDELVVFLWDEVPDMVSAIEGNRGAGTARAILDVLRYCRESFSSVRMILSGSLGMHHVVNKLRLQGGSWTPTNDVATIDLPPLDVADATYLATELLRNENIACEPTEQDLAAAVAGEVDSIPFYVHHLVNLLQKHQGEATGPVDQSTVVEIVEGVLVDPSDPLQLRHYVDRVPVYYPEEAELAYRVLDIVAGRPEGCSLNEIRELLAVQMEPPAAERLHGLLELLCKDHYLVLGYRFRIELVRRAWRAKRQF